MSAPGESWEDMPVELRARFERQLLRAHRASVGVSTAPAASTASAEVGSRIPLSFAQQRFWFLDQYETNGSVYNVSRAFRLQGEVNPAAIERALTAIVVRHESLRTTFAILDDEPVQKIAHSARVRLSIVDLSTLPPQEREQQLVRLMTEETRRPFCLSEDLMLRGILYRLNARDHALIVATHHIASDAWSLEILLRELSMLYAANLMGQSVTLQDLPMQYAHYAIQQRDSIKRGTWKQQLDYWKHQLDGMPALLKLPNDAPRPARESFRGKRLCRRFPGDLVPKLKRIGQESGATFYMTLLGAFQVLLSRYSGEEDIFVGSPVAGRNRIETEGLIGLFVNTIVLRNDLSGDPTFRELLTRVRETALGAFCHQDLPFERLVEELRPERNLSHSPLYQVIYALQNTTQAELHIPGAVVSPISLEPGTAKLDQTWEAIEHADRLEVRVEYNRDLFREETIARMMDHYRVLLESIVADPDQPISQLPILTDLERQQILVDWAVQSPPRKAPELAPTEQVDSPDAARKIESHSAAWKEFDCYHRQFEKQAAESPRKVAVRFGDDQLTYQELNERANRLAHSLQKSGVRRETLVGVFLPRSPRLLVTLIAIAKSGGAYVPLETDLPPERLKFLLEDSQVGIVVTESALTALLDRTAVQLVVLDADAPEIGSQSSANPVSDVSADDLCYVLYTSGSTGRPKGVQVLHRGLSNFLESCRHAPGFHQDDVMAAGTRTSFDVSTLELFLPLVTGAQLVLVDRETAQDGNRFQQELRKHHVTVMFATPVGWEILLQAGPLPRELKVICGGEELRPDLAATLKHQAAELWNLYGPTETTVASTFEKIDSLDPIFIGRPIANTEVYVLDKFRQPVPIGVPGELYIGGAGLARGYWNRPELTIEKFVTHPFSTDATARLYRTGDSVRWHSDGRLEYLGRFDHQVKIRGFRIETGEIEKCLAGHPQIEDCAVVVQDNGENRAQLVAYVVPVQDAAIDMPQLRDWLSRELPDYMIPGRFARLDVLPRLPNGKLDRKSLSVRIAEMDDQQRTIVPPNTPLEHMLTEIWREVLGLEQVGLHDNFFELGGHSLSAMRVVARLRDRCRVDVSVRAVFEALTVYHLAKALSGIPELAAQFESVRSA